MFSPPVPSPPFNVFTVPGVPNVMTVPGVPLTPARPATRRSRHRFDSELLFCLCLLRSSKGQEKERKPTNSFFLRFRKERRPTQKKISIVHDAYCLPCARDPWDTERDGCEGAASTASAANMEIKARSAHP